MRFPWRHAFKVSIIVVSLAALLPMGSPTESSSPTTPSANQFIYLPVVARSEPLPTIPSSDNWLVYLNYYRATAYLPPVTENLVWSEGDRKHAIYIVKNNVLQHYEDPGNPWYTPEGQTAAQQSNLAASYDPNASDRWAIDSWMQAPFHAVGMLDPRLVQIGYGSYREADGNLQMGAALNVIAGRDATVQATFPVLWPGNNTTVPIRLHWGETPNPLTSCPGYTAPSGLPLVVQMGSGNVTQVVSASSFTQNGQALEHCVFDETTYSHPDPSQRDLGRGILAARDAVVLIPRAPLSSGMAYNASLTVNGQTYEWSFRVSPNASMSRQMILDGLVR